MKIISNPEKASENFINIFNKAQSMCIITGAGISTGSGIPDFRGKEGIYKKSGTNVFNLKTFKENPSIFYEFAKDYIRLVKNSKPNSAHLLIAELEKTGKITAIITQNIDGLHRKAGSKNLFEIHGTFDTFKCLDCGRKYFLNDIENKIEKGKVPYCIECGGIIKPEVVFFGEKININMINKIKNIATHSEYCVVMGSSLVVHPVAEIPECTLNNEGQLIIINKGETPFDEYAYEKYEVEIESFSSKVLKKIKKRFILF